jgi:hypothetical protein
MRSEAGVRSHVVGEYYLFCMHCLRERLAGFEPFNRWIDAGRSVLLEPKLMRTPVSTAPAQTALYALKYGPSNSSSRL